MSFPVQRSASPASKRPSRFALSTVVCLCVMVSNVGWTRSADGAEASDGVVATERLRLTPEVRDSISRGLKYLAQDNVQNDDGSWGGGTNPVAETSLTLMAFMVQGHIPGRGIYGEKIDNGIIFLINKGQSQRGFLGSGKNHAAMYEHGLAVLALSEAWGQSKNTRLRHTLRRAVDVILRSQNKAGGWRYEPEPKDADLSMTVMQLVALNSAKESGIAVPEETMRRAKDYVLSCQDNTSGGFRYMPGNGEPGFARTAAGVMSLIMCGYHKDVKAQNGITRGMEFLINYPDNKKFAKNYPRFHYSHYYAVQAMYQSRNKNHIRAWYPKIATTILSKQGSDGGWDGAHGKAYGTSLSILILGVPYRYLPIYQR